MDPGGDTCTVSGVESGHLGQMATSMFSVVAKSTGQRGEAVVRVQVSVRSLFALV